jgi:hypothetical protein
MINELILQGVEMLVILAVGALVYMRHKDMQKELNKIRVLFDAEHRERDALGYDVEHLKMRVNDLTEDVLDDLAKLKKNRR